MYENQLQSIMRRLEASRHTIAVTHLELSSMLSPAHIGAASPDMRADVLLATEDLAIEVSLLIAMVRERSWGQPVSSNQADA